MKTGMIEAYKECQENIERFSDGLAMRDYAKAAQGYSDLTHSSFEVICKRTDKCKKVEHILMSIILNIRAAISHFAEYNKAISEPLIPGDLKILYLDRILNEESKIINALLSEYRKLIREELMFVFAYVSE